VRILFAGSDTIYRECAVSLREAAGTEPLRARDRESLLATLSDPPPDLVLLDGEEPGFPIDTSLPLVRRLCPELPVLVLSREEDAEELGNVFRLGATDLVRLPLAEGRLVEMIRAFAAAPVRGEETKASQGESASDALLFSANPRMRALREMVDKVKDTDLPILIAGESGTGKEIVAKYLWKNSSRRNRPFFKVNCAAIPSELLESELFGFEKGAFTGAYRKKPGKFVAADGGTLLLDEIGELPYPLQSKLLHVLQDGNFSALGSTQDVSVDVRVITATNRVLEEAVRLGTFRSDLYFRLNVLQLHVPPLRERPEDILPLAIHFLARFAEQYGKPVLTLGPGTRALLSAYSWPGNVRELENLMRRATVLGDERFAFKDTPLDPQRGAGPAPAPGPAPDTHFDPGGPSASPAPAGREPRPSPGSLKEIGRLAAREAEREAIARVLADTHWNRKKAAKLLDISYKTLLTKIKETGLDDV
jgi:two-component system, NtrC family, response regulator AtoC